MILYAVEYRGKITNNMWSIVSIWKDQDSAEKEKGQCIENWKEHEEMHFSEYRIKKIDTDSNDPIYDYDK